jgi:hypothetical protein
MAGFTRAFLGCNYPIYHAVVLAVALVDLAIVFAIWRRLK